MKPLYIFDLDGTLALNEHRQHFLYNPWQPFEENEFPVLMPHYEFKYIDGLAEYKRLKKKPDWDGFFKACVDDKPNIPVITVFNQLAEARNTSNGDYANEVWVWSGRSRAVKCESTQWLMDHTALDWGSSVTEFRMRPEGDYTPDDELKEKWLNEMSPEDRARLVCVFDDRQKVVAMWRRNGVVCMQVAEGDF